MKFELNEVERARVKEWQKALVVIYGEELGGWYEYTFIPNGVGTVVKVKHNPSGHEIDVTDVDSW